MMPRKYRQNKDLAHKKHYFYNGIHDMINMCALLNNGVIHWELLWKRKTLFPRLQNQ